MSIKTLLFDADGTLLDFEKAEHNAFRKTLNTCGYSGSFEAALNIYIDINIELWKSFEKGEISQDNLRTMRFEKLIEELHLSVTSKPEDSPASEYLSDTYLNFLGEGGYLIENGLETVKTLHDTGRYSMAIITNGIKHVQYSRLNASGLDEYFDNIIISGEIGIQKPKKEFFDIALKMMNNSNRDEYLVIGDTYSSDIAGGINAGIKTCWYNPEKKSAEGKQAPDYEITDLTELPGLLERI